MSNQSNTDTLQIKIVLVGSFGSGRTALMSRYCNRVFTHVRETTIGIDYKIRELEIQKRKVKLQIFDPVNGGCRFREIAYQYFPKSDAILLLYSAGDRESFNEVSKNLEIVKTKCLNTVPKPLLYLVATKIDESCVITDEEAIAYSNENHLKYFKTSAKEYIGIDELFLDVSQCVLNEKYKDIILNDNNNNNNNNDNDDNDENIIDVDQTNTMSTKPKAIKSKKKPPQPIQTNSLFNYFSKVDTKQPVEKDEPTFD